MKGRSIHLLAGVIAGVLALPAGASAAVLYDQTDSAGTNNANSGQPDFAPSNDFGGGAIDRTADDFTVPVGATWSIQEIDVLGAFSQGGGGPNQQVNVYLYADASGRPGTELFSRSAVPVTGGPNFVVPVTNAPALGPGIYWVTVQFVANVGFWSWTTRTVQSGNPAQHFNPTTIGPGCPGATWNRRTDCWFGSNPDQVFRLQGVLAPVRCDGEPATIVGTTGSDRLSGTPGRDVVVGHGGDDELSGLGGGDVICGGKGRDTVRGDAGKDTLIGGAQADRLLGGAGKDRLFGGTPGAPPMDAIDTCLGQAGSDVKRNCEKGGG